MANPTRKILTCLKKKGKKLAREFNIDRTRYWNDNVTDWMKLRLHRCKGFSTKRKTRSIGNPVLSF